MEYLSTIVISAIVLYAGITALFESVKALIHPKEVEYTAVTIILLSIALIVKLLLGSYFKRVGKKNGADSLVISGTESTMDTAVSGLYYDKERKWIS